MGDFALVTEGVTDHQVLKNILIGFFKDQREPEITFEHPNPQDSNKYGGWTLVLRYLREKRYKDVFQFNRHVVVQVDTDVAEDLGFDVPRQDANGPLSLPAFIARVVDRLQSEIGEEDCKTYGGRFLFAIGVDQMECWLLPLWFAGSKGEQTVNCVKRLAECPQLRDSLDKKGCPWISVGRKDARSYDLASREYRKRAALFSEGPRNPSLAAFLQDLERRAIQLPPLE